MRVVKYIILVLLLAALASPAFAGGKVRALYLMPWVPGSVQVPILPDDWNDVCTVTGGELSGGTQVTAYRRGQSENWEIPNDGKIPRRCFDKVEVPCVPTKSCVPTPKCYADINRCVSRVLTEGAYCTDTDVSCDAIESQETFPVDFKKQVYLAQIGDTVGIEASGYTWGVKTVKYRIIVRYFEPGITDYTVILRSDREKEVVDGVFYDDIGSFTFDKDGTYAFILLVWRPNGTIATARSRVAVSTIN